MRVRKVSKKYGSWLAISAISVKTFEYFIFLFLICSDMYDRYR